LPAADHRWPDEAGHAAAADVVFPREARERLARIAKGEVEMTDPGEGGRASALIGGALLLIVGALLVVQNFGLVEAGSLSDYWPLFLVWVGARRMFGPNRREHFISGAVLLCLGVLLQLDQLGWTGVSIGDLWPVFLVAVGAAMILEGLRGRRAEAAIGSPGGGESGGRS
jgi:uncharacterized membrane protein HdeD (DUF308 family)